jgi:transposase
LFTLRNAHLAWQQGEEKGEPWNTYHLILYCCVDTRLWTAEGTEQVREENADAIAKTLANMKEKGDLSKTQQAFVQKLQSTLARSKNPFERPSQPLYQGQPHILIGVGLGLDKPATIAVVDATTNNVITYRSTRQLLGDNYELLNRQRRQQQSLSHNRHKAQKSAGNIQFGESELGQYVDRLLAKEIVAIARTYQAGSIVLPKLDDMREILTSGIQARAEAKCPNHVEGQQKYAKQYRISIHKWSYGRLIQNIQSQAAKAEIVVEEGKQPIRGSPQEQARKLAIAAYQSRQPQ